MSLFQYVHAFILKGTTAAPASRFSIAQDDCDWFKNTKKLECFFPFATEVMSADRPSSSTDTLLCGHGAGCARLRLYGETELLTKEVEWVSASKEFPEDVFWVAECERFMEMFSVVEMAA